MRKPRKHVRHSKPAPVRQHKRTEQEVIQRAVRDHNAFNRRRQVRVDSYFVET